MDRESLELLLGQGLSVEKIAKRFGKDPSTVSYWMAKYGLVAVNRDKHAAKGGIERTKLEALIAQHMSIAEIADALGLSKATVRYWMRRYGVRTKNSRRGQVARAAKEAGLLTTTMTCRSHGATEFILEGRGQYRCKRCRADRVARRRRKVKAILVAEAGGRCASCGYDGYVGALEFHHLDPRDKRHTVAEGAALSLESLRSEARKCVLLCSNCHAEVEAGVRSLPLESSRSAASH